MQSSIHVYTSQQVFTLTARLLSAECARAGQRTDDRIVLPIAKHNDLVGWQCVICMVESFFYSVPKIDHAVHAPQHWHESRWAWSVGQTACNFGTTRPATLQDRRRSAGLAAVVPPISRAGRGIGATSAPQPAGLVLLPPAGRGGGRAVTAQPLDRFRQCHHACSSRSDLTAYMM